MPEISPLYAGLLALLFLMLSARVSAGRYKHKISIGDGGEKDMVKRIRVQANCAEYVPIGILMLVLAEMQGMPGWLVHFFGLTLLTGRIMHAYGLGSSPQVPKFRIWGMYLTVGMIAVTALSNVGHALF